MLIRSRLTEKHSISVLREHEVGAKTSDVARKQCHSEATLNNWTSRYGGMEVSEARRLKQFEGGSDGSMAPGTPWAPVRRCSGGVPRHHGCPGHPPFPPPGADGTDHHGAHHGQGRRGRAEATNACDHALPHRPRRGLCAANPDVSNRGACSLSVLPPYEGVGCDTAFRSYQLSCPIEGSAPTGDGFLSLVSHNVAVCWAKSFSVRGYGQRGVACRSRT
jgi:hypothetical protein